MSKKATKTNQVYVWTHVKHLTSYYHSSGGLMVIAPTFIRAIELIREKMKPNPDPNDWRRPDLNERCDALAQAPDMQFTTDKDEQVIIWPDAGCC